MPVENKIVIDNVKSEIDIFFFFWARCKEKISCFWLLHVNTNISLSLLNLGKQIIIAV